MGKAIVTANLGGGRYSVRIVWDRGSFDRRLANLDAGIDEWAARVEELRIAESAASVRRSTICRAEPGSDGCIQAAAAWRAAKIAYDVGRVRLRAMKTQRAAFSGAMPDEPVVNAWCADLTEDIAVGSVVGTVETPGETVPAGRVQIRPGWEGAWTWSEPRDYMITPAAAADPFGNFCNRCWMPGWQKWMPTFRYGTISDIDTDANTGTVSLDPALSAPQYGGYDINVPTTLANVPVVYMDCHASAFADGDHVLVEFQGQKWNAPRVVGFYEEPKGCGFYVLVTYEGEPGAPKYIRFFSATDAAFSAATQLDAAGVAGPFTAADTGRAPAYLEHEDWGRHPVAVADAPTAPISLPGGGEADARWFDFAPIRIVITINGGPACVDVSSRGIAGKIVRLRYPDGDASEGFVTAFDGSVEIPFSAYHPDAVLELYYRSTWPDGSLSFEFFEYYEPLPLNQCENLREPGANGLYNAVAGGARHIGIFSDSLDRIPNQTLPPLEGIPEAVVWVYRSDDLCPYVAVDIEAPGVSARLTKGRRRGFRWDGSSWRAFETEYGGETSGFPLYWQATLETHVTYEDFNSGCRVPDIPCSTWWITGFRDQADTNVRTIPPAGHDWHFAARLHWLPSPGPISAHSGGDGVHRVDFRVCNLRRNTALYWVNICELEFYLLRAREYLQMSPQLSQFRTTPTYLAYNVPREAYQEWVMDEWQMNNCGEISGAFCWVNMDNGSNMTHRSIHILFDRASGQAVFDDWTNNVKIVLFHLDGFATGPRLVETYEMVEEVDPEQY